MTDTIKMRRPRFPRQEGGPGGRVEHDSRGNAVWVRTRATDTAEVAVSPCLSLVDDSPGVNPLPLRRSAPKGPRH